MQLQRSHTAMAGNLNNYKAHELQQSQQKHTEKMLYDIICCISTHYMVIYILCKVHLFIMTTIIVVILIIYIYIYIKKLKNLK